MSEREQRYEEALRRAKGLAGVFGDVSAERDAAMAVADAEQRGLRENLESAEAEIREQDAEIASLRKEQQETRDHFDRMDTIVRQERNSARNRVAELRTETARLRAIIEHGGGECADGHVMTTDMWANGDPVSGRRCHFCKTEESAE